MLIRHATSHDVIQIATVNVATWHTTYRRLIPDEVLYGMTVEKQAEGVRSFLENKELRSFILVAEEKGNIVGYLIGGKEREGYPGYDGEVYAVYVLKDYQHKGLGSRLMCSAVNEFIKMGFSSMIVWVLKSNPYCRFYQRINGDLAGEREFHGMHLVGYGWRDLSPMLLSRSAALPAASQAACISGI